jgi:hypothetical protein
LKTASEHDFVKNLVLVKTKFFLKASEILSPSRSEVAPAFPAEGGVLEARNVSFFWRKREKRPLIEKEFFN